MKSKFLNVIRVVLAASFLTSFVVRASTSPFDLAIIGKCFNNASLAKASVLGTPAAPDENITSHASGISPNSEWIVDRTPGANFAWYLLEQRNGQSCFTLYIPFASDVTIKRSAGLTIVEARTQASPGGPSYEMRFSRSKKLGRYVPVQCFEVRQPDAVSVPTRRAIDCLKVGDD